MTVRIRADLAALPKYVPGASRPGAIKLASNEVSDAPLPSVVAAISAAAQEVNRYPDHGAVELRAALANHVAVSPDQIAVGNGSVELCYDLVRLTCSGPGDEVLFAWRSFEAYPIAVSLAGATAVTVPLTERHGLDLDAMAAAVTENTRLIFVCNPNNPTGTLLSAKAIEAFVATVPSHITIVLDEAYVEYTAAQPAGAGVGVIDAHPNVVVLRTFSKAYGLAGLRIGYAVGESELIASLSAVRLPFSANRIAQAAALASLDAKAELMDRVDQLVAERDRVIDAVRALEIEVADSGANFFYLPLGARADRFAEACAAHGIIVRCFSGDGVRITVGTADENEKMLAAVRNAITA